MPMSDSSESQRAFKAFTVVYFFSAWARQPEAQPWQGHRAQSGFAQPQLEGQQQMGTNSVVGTGTLMAGQGCCRHALTQGTALLAEVVQASQMTPWFE